MKETYYSNDRTFCSKSDCKETRCDVHQSHIRFPVREISMADYSVTSECLLNERKES